MTTKKIFLSSTLIIIALFSVGCLVSGTFVISETFIFDFTTQDGFYTEAINLENNADWEEHEDKLDKVEIIGFELWITNNEPVEWKYWANLDEYDVNCTTLSCANASSTKFLIFDTLTIPAATSTGSSKYISYAESFNYIKNLDKIRDMVFGGSFNYYGFATGGAGGNGGKVDSVRIIITVNASET